MSKIAVDIDSTLYDFETPAREAMLRLYKETGDRAFKEGAYHPWTEWRAPADVLTDENGRIDRWLDAIALCHDADVIESMKPFDGAVETCQALIRAGHELLYISNRATEAGDATERWLKTNGFLDQDPWLEGQVRPTVMCLTGDKAPHMADCQYIIDDRLKTVVEFVNDYDWRTGVRNGDKEERKAFVKAYPYNQAATDIPNLYLAQTWAGLNEYLVSKGVLPEPATIPLGVLG